MRIDDSSACCLQVLLDDPHVFSCHPTLSETIWHSEVGASAAILAAGCGSHFVPVAQSMRILHPASSA